MKRRAFTLIELLVVIAIIGLLSTIAVVSLVSSRAKARNAKRVADIRQIITAFELGRDASTTGEWPSSGGNVWVLLSTTAGGAWAYVGRSAVVDAFYQPFMSPIPTDPVGDSRSFSGYVYDGAWPGNATFSAGSYISYALEPPSTCVGAVFSTTGTTIQCVFKLEN